LRDNSRPHRGLSVSRRSGRCSPETENPLINKGLLTQAFAEGFDWSYLAVLAGWFH